MKKFTKIAMAVAVVFSLTGLFSLNANAQSTALGEIRFGIGVEAGAPIGNAHTYLSSFEAGGTGRFQIGLSNNLAAIVTSGYYNMFSKQTNINGVAMEAPGLGIIPVKGGIKAFLGSGVYLTGEAGAGFETSKDDNTNQKDTKLILSPGLGYATKSLDFGVRYENFSGQHFNYGLIGLRVAYGFRIAKGDK